MAAALIYIKRYMRYTRHTPYIWEVVRFALYDRCRFLLEKVIFGLLHLALLGQECTLSVPISYQGLLGKSSRKVALGVPKRQGVRKMLSDSLFCGQFIYRACSLRTCSARLGSAFLPSGAGGHAVARAASCQ